jgi:hypothetical protein
VSRYLIDEKKRTAFSGDAFLDLGLKF